MNKQLREALIRERRELKIKLNAINLLLDLDREQEFSNQVVIKRPNKPNKYFFKKINKGETYIISDHYSREEMAKVSNAARNWSNKGGHGYMFQFKKTPDNKIEIRRIK